jgi:large subunit ribosomal protein L4
MRTEDESVPGASSRGAVEPGSLTASLRAVDGGTVGEVVLPELFAERPREHLIYEVVNMQLASRRGGNAATKTRAFVSGGGKKPWRQKGTGRARAGSTRSPLWAGGAAVFGPQPRSYAYQLPAKARRVALRSVMADRQRTGGLTIVDQISLAEPKTKQVVAMLKALGLEGSVLIVSRGEDQALERAARNLPSVKVLRSQGLNVYDVLKHKHLVMTKDALAAVAERLAS